MYILITNDDGIHAPGLAALAREAAARGHRVLVCAPAEQQSAASQRIQLNTPLMASPVDLMPGVTAWAVEGTPADCVRIGFELSDGTPDLCLSGINDGENAGCAAFYSGTIGAAREAAMHGVAAFAVSIMQHADAQMLQDLASEALRMAEGCDLKAFPRLAVISLNAPAIPRSQWRGIRLCPLSQAYYLDRYEHRINPRGRHYFWLGQGLPMEKPEPGSDYDLLNQGFATISVLGGYQTLHEHPASFLNAAYDDPEATA